MSSTPNPKHDTTNSPPATHTSTGTSGHKNSLKGTKLARRARSFKDDIFEKFSQMRTPTNTLGRSHSPHRHSPRSKHALNISPERKPTQGIDYHVRQIKNALKHFKDVVSKKKLEVLPGNATILLELTANMRSALQLYALNPNSNTLSSACTQVYYALGELIKLCDNVLLSENEQDNPLLSNENVQVVVNLLESSVQNWCDIVNEKMQEKENSLSVTAGNNSSSNTLHRPTIDVAGQRTSLPDIHLTPNERDILEKSSLSTMKTSHSTESILRDSSPPPKPPLPNRCSNPPPLPPKRRSQKQNSITNESNFSVDSSLLSCGLDHLSMRSRSPDDNSSLLSASAGSLDSAFNHSREEDELKALTMDTSFEDHQLEDDVGHMLSMTNRKEETVKSALPSTLMIGKNQRNSNESGFASMQSIRASMQSISTKRSSEHSTQSHKSSIASSTEISSLKPLEMKIDDEIDNLMDQSMANSSGHMKSISCFSSQTVASMEHCVTTSCNFLRSSGEMCSTKKHVVGESETFNARSENTAANLTMAVIKTNNQDVPADIFTSSVQTIKEEPPAIPVKTRTKSTHKERQVSHYDNVEELDHLSALSRDEMLEPRHFPTALHLQRKHQSLIDPRRCHAYRDHEDPPPIPKKTKHIMAYMEILPAPSSIEHFRHSVHTCNSTQTSCQFTSARNISHSQTMNMTSISKQLISQTSSSPMPDTDKPPALPPKKHHQRMPCKTPTIITTPPPSPKPGMLTGSYDMRSRVLGSSLNNDMLTVNEESNNIAEEEELSHNMFSEYNNDGEDEVVLRNNTINKQECLTPNKDDSMPELIEELDISKYLVMKKEGEDGPDVKGGHFDALIVHASKVQRNENAFSEAFITTFRTFIKPLDLIVKLISRYTVFNCQVNDQHKQKAAKETFSLLVRVVNDLTASDLHLDLLSKLTDFVYQMVRSGELPSAKALRCKVVEKANLYKTLKKEANDKQEPQRDIAKSLPSLLDLKSVEIAEQMTLLDAELFQKIEIPEVLIFVKEQCEEKSPNLNRFTEHFNKMSYWARSQILSQDDAKDREKYVIKFIKIMKHLRKMNNYNSYLALLSALDSAPIRRLEWHKTITEGLKEYCALIDSSSSFRVYRQALAETSPPCIPYIGLVLQDLTFVHVGNPDYLKENVINFSKRWQQHNIIVNMKKFKNCKYPFRRNEKIIRFFENFENYLEEEQMWQISESIKPRGRKPTQN